MSKQQSSKEQELLKRIDHLELENDFLRQQLIYYIDKKSSEKERREKEKNCPRKTFYNRDPKPLSVKKLYFK